MASALDKIETLFRKVLGAWVVQRDRLAEIESGSNARELEDIRAEIETFKTAAIKAREDALAEMRRSGIVLSVIEIEKLKTKLACIRQSNGSFLSEMDEGDIQQYASAINLEYDRKFSGISKMYLLLKSDPSGISIIKGTTSDVKVTKGELVPNLEKITVKATQQVSTEKTEGLPPDAVATETKRKVAELIDGMSKVEPEFDDIQTTMDKTPPTVIKVDGQNYNNNFTEVLADDGETNARNLIKSLSAPLDAISSTNPVCVIAYGPSGSGKTFASLRLLEEMLKKENSKSISAIQWYQPDWQTETFKFHDMLKCIHSASNTDGFVKEEGGKIGFGEKGDWIDSSKGSKFHIKGRGLQAADKPFLFSDEPQKGTPYIKGALYSTKNPDNAFKCPKEEIGDYDKFLQKLELVRLTRETLMNDMSSRTVTFLRVHDSNGNVIALIIDLPGNEERDQLLWQQALKERATLAPLFKEADVIRHALPYMRGLFKEKKQNGVQKDIEGQLKGLKYTPLDNSSERDFSITPRMYTALKPLIDPLLKKNSTLVLLLTSYKTLPTSVSGIKLEDLKEVRRKTMKDTYEFVKTIEATEPALCNIEASLTKRGGKKLISNNNGRNTAIKRVVGCNHRTTKRMQAKRTRRK